MPTIWTSAAAPNEFLEIRSELIERLLETEPFSAGKWQRLDVTESRAHDTYELQHLNIYYPMPDTPDQAMAYIQPDLPWAEGHFLERVAGEPVNPGEWHHRWPYHAGQVKLHQSAGQYEHNYMERMWPKDAGLQDDPRAPRGWRRMNDAAYGYRFRIGDLEDVVQLLLAEPYTRQAYLPIWFPEDTGVVEGQRVPCTLGYHFMIRDNELHLSYHLRSCEAYRHFTNDVYMAVRLAQYMATRYNSRQDVRGAYIVPGNLHLTAASFHGFVGDTAHLESMIGV